MLIVLASCFDEAIDPLVQALQCQTGQMVLPLTCRDLSLPGWVDSLDAWQSGRAVVSGQSIPVTAIQGVFGRLPWVLAPELQHIRAIDRSYVATEMTAFLAAWLSRLPCPVLNRPAPDHLMGPYWHPVQWIQAAARLGIAVSPFTLEASLETNLAANTAKLPNTQPLNQPRATVTVVGETWVGEVDPALGAAALRLAQWAGVDFLSVHFDSVTAAGRCTGADYWPNLDSPTLIAAIADYFSNRRSTPSPIPLTGGALC